MHRQAFKMHLQPGAAPEYQRRHAEIWPELKDLLRAAGISEYSIFLDAETDTLFAFQKVNEGAGSQELGDNPVVQRWWQYMADLMVTNPDNSPVSVALPAVFYLP